LGLLRFSPPGFDPNPALYRIRISFFQNRIFGWLTTLIGFNATEKTVLLLIGNSRGNVSSMVDEAEQEEKKQAETGDLVGRRILNALRGLKFGSVEITVHEGRIVQIERREKHRLSMACPDHSR
jgi:hypothetical protein